MLLKFSISICIFLACFFIQANEGVQAEPNRQSMRFLSPTDEVQAELNERLFQATQQGNVEEVRRLLDAGADPNARNSLGRTPLHTVRHLAVARVLRERGADVSARDNIEDTPLHTTRTLEVAQFLVVEGADVNAKNKSMRAPLQWMNDLEITRFLIEEGADVDAADDLGGTALSNAQFYQHSQRIRLLLEVGMGSSIGEQTDSSLPQVSSEPKKKETPCEYSAESSHIKGTLLCGQENICMSEVSCIFKVGIAPNTTQIERQFRVVCSSLSNGECPEAENCVLDRSMTEIKEASNKMRQIKRGQKEHIRQRQRARHGVR